MSIEVVTIVNFNGSVGSTSVTGAVAGDKVVGIQSITFANYGYAADLTSYFETTISVSGEMQETTAMAGAETAIVVLARGV